MWWYTFLITALGKQSQEDLHSEFKASKTYMARPSLKKKKNKEQKPPKQTKKEKKRKKEMKLYLTPL